MALVTLSLDIFLLTSLAVLLPSIYYIARPVPLSRRAYRPPLRTPLSVLVLIHTLYILYVLLVTPPPNLFARLRIPVTTPADKIRSLILQRSQLTPDTPLPPALDGLLTRLASFDARTIYIRFGHAVVQGCEYCHTFDEYLLHWLPAPLLSYVREAAVLGFLTALGSYRERWRTYAVGALVAAAVAEVYWLTTVQVKIPRDGQNVMMWHDTLWSLRQLLFLILPAFVHLVPSPPPPPTLQSALLSTPSPSTPHTLPVAISALDQALGRLRLLQLTRGAVQRAPELRDASRTWWERGRREGTWVRQDEGVQRAAERLGLGFGEPVQGEDESDAKEARKLRTGARTSVATLAKLFQAQPVDGRAA